MFNIPAPKDWQTFESLCKDLWGEILNDRNIQLNGRSGQPQYGVDIFGVDKINNQNYGIQCKQKGYFKNLTSDEVDSEINKAQTFLPKLDVYIVATTAQKDQNIEAYVRKISEINIKNGKFSVYVLGWEDIVEKLNIHQSILQKYYGRLLNPRTPNDHYFDFWYNKVFINKLFYYACYLPFGGYDIRYSYTYLNYLSAYLNKHDVFLANTQANFSDNVLKKYIQKFNSEANALISNITEYPPKESYTHSGDDIVNIYWVECDHLDYSERGKYVQHRKMQVRQAFYNLIKVANKIISVWNMQLDGVPQIELTEFAQKNPNYPLLGGIYLIEPHYPT